VRAGGRDIIGRGHDGSQRQLRLGFGALPGPGGDGGERLGRLGRAPEIRLGQLHLDELREKWYGDQAVPTNLVQAAVQTGRREGGLAASQVQVDHRLDGLGEVLVAAK
jgi:hypothetical protein